MPVIHCEGKYIVSAQYDDMVNLRTSRVEFNQVLIS